MAKSNLRTKKRIVLKSLLAISLLACLLCLLIACDGGSGSDTPCIMLGDDFKTTYYVGEAFVPGATLALYRGDRFVSFETLTEDMVSGFDTSVARDILVDINCGEFHASVLVYVLPITAESVTLDEETLPDELYLGEGFPSGATFTARMSNGTVRRNIVITPNMLGGFDPNRVGAQTVLLGYYGASASFLITVKENKPEEISDLLDEKKEYFVNEGLRVHGARIEIRYTNGKTVQVDLSEEMVKGFSTAHGGAAQATVEYKGMTFPYEYVVQRRVKSFTLKEGTLPALYEKDANNALPTTGIALVIYDDAEEGAEPEEYALTEENFVGFDTSSSGEKEDCLIVIDGKSVPYLYTVLRTILTMTPVGYSSDVEQYAAFDKQGELVVEYDTGEWQSIPFSNDGLLTFDYHTDEVGEEVVQRVSFRGLSRTFIVCVYPESERDAVEEVRVVDAFGRVMQGDPDAIEKMIDGVNVEIVYKHKASVVTLCLDQWVQVDLETPIEGDFEMRDVTVTIDSGDSAPVQQVFVFTEAYSNKITSLAVQGFKGKPCVVGAPLSSLIEGAILIVTYGGGYRTEYVAVEEEYVSDFDSSASGEKTLRIDYGGYPDPVEVTYYVMSEEERNAVTAVMLPDFNPLLFVGDEISDIDPTDYELTVIYGYGDHEGRIPLELSMLTGGPFVAEGRYVLTLSYEGVETTVFVMVYAQAYKTTVTALAVNPQTVYSHVGIAPDLSGCELEVECGNGYDRYTIPLLSEGVTVAPYSTASSGTVRVEITYENASCYLFISFASGGSDGVQ